MERLETRGEQVPQDESKHKAATYSNIRNTDRETVRGIPRETFARPQYPAQKDQNLVYWPCFSHLSLTIVGFRTEERDKSWRRGQPLLGPNMPETNP
jgi:hypothetical protein